MNVRELLEPCRIVSPALATGNNAIPALKCFKFTGENVSAYDGSIAIQTPCNTEFTGIIPGNALLKFLESLKADTLKIEAGDNTFKCSAGRSRIKLSTLNEDEYPHTMSKGGRAPSLTWTGDLAKAMSICAQTLNIKESRPQLRGVTLRVSPDGAVFLNSSNAISITSCSASTEVSGVKKDVTVVISNEACKTLSKIKGEATLKLTHSFILYEADNFILQGRTIQVEDLSDMESTIDRYVSDMPKDVAISEDFSNTLNRMDSFKAVRGVNILGTPEGLALSVDDPALQVEEDLDLEHEFGDDFKQTFDPALLVQAMSHAQAFSIGPQCIKFSSTEPFDYVRVIAPLSEIS